MRSYQIRSESDGRWPWKLSLREIVGGPELERCPSIDQIGVEAKSIRRQSHIRLDEKAGILAEELLKRALGA